MNTIGVVEDVSTPAVTYGPPSSASAIDDSGTPTASFVLDVTTLIFCSSVNPTAAPPARGVATTATCVASPAIARSASSAGIGAPVHVIALHTDGTRRGVAVPSEAGGPLSPLV